MPSLPLPANFNHSSSENLSSDASYPVGGSAERIARLRSDLQGVRTGIQLLVSGLHDLNETANQQDLASQARFPSFTMSARSAERSPPRGSRPIFQGNLEASAWSNNPSSPHFHNPSTVRNHSRQETARPRPTGQDPMLRVRQRAYLESDQQRQPTAPFHPGSDAATRNAHPRSMHENSFAGLGGSTGEAERPDLQSPVPNLFGNAWSEYRDTEAPRQGPNPALLNRVPNAERRPAMPNPLANPPLLPQYTPPYFVSPALNGSQPYLNPISLPGMTTPELTPPAQYHPREVSTVLPPRWSFHPVAATTGDGRPQNVNAPDRPVEHADNTSSMRRTLETQRRATHRGESEGGAYGRAVELSGIDLAATRTGYPYILPNGLSRSQFLEGYHARESGSESGSEPCVTFDTQDRPPPMDPDSMMVDMACSICKEHLIDTVVLPCGHAVMCNWCADLHVPSCKQDKSIPKDRSVKCPMCRSKIKQKFKIFHS